MEEARKPFWGHCGTERDRRNQRRIVGWAMLWMASTVGIKLGIKSGVLPAGAPAIGATILSGTLGIGTVLVYRRFLREADELRRKIELDAFALAMGVGVVGAFTFSLMEQAGAIAEADLLLVIAGMVLTQAAAVVVGQRRYS